MPSIINATTSTGLVSSADNSGSLQLATNNGTTAVTITTGQNVGIGTASPGAKVEISGTAAAQNLALRITNTATDGYSTLQLGGSGDGGLFRNGSTQSAYGGANSLNLITVGAHNIGFATNNTERMRIDASGDIFAGGTNINGATGSIYSKTNAKAFVQWQGSNGTINQSKNISSVSRTGTGAYTVAYSITFSTNYVIVLGGSRNNGITDNFAQSYYGQASTQVNILAYAPNAFFIDAYSLDLVIFA